MRIVVLGSGVVGVTAAWYLAEAGHDVVVVDRKEGPALETSFANAGEISPGYASPWAAPAIPWKAVRWLLMRHPRRSSSRRRTLPCRAGARACWRHCRPRAFRATRCRLAPLGTRVPQQLTPTARAPGQITPGAPHP